MANVTNVNIDRLKSLAKSQGITMKYLCDCLGKHRGFLSCVRNGTDRIDEEELALIADKINTTVAYLTGQTDDPEPPAVPPELPDKNTLWLVGRDGKRIERQLSDEQMQMLRALVSQLPEAPDNKRK